MADKRNRTPFYGAVPTSKLQADHVFMADGSTVEEALQDYIVEEGTNGNFYYRKWNSGYAELDYIKTVNIGGITSPSGTLYYASIPVNTTFPFEFTQTPCVSVACFFASTNAWVWPASYITTTSLPDFFCGRGTAYSSGTSVHFSAHITGKWR